MSECVLEIGGTITSRARVGNDFLGCVLFTFWSGSKLVNGSAKFMYLEGGKRWMPRMPMHKTAAKNGSSGHAREFTDRPALTQLVESF